MYTLYTLNSQKCENCGSLNVYSLYINNTTVFLTTALMVEDSTVLLEIGSHPKPEVLVMP